MVNDIVQKLALELQQDIASERQVVYILVEIRKLIDTDNLAKKFEALNLHCDWALHTKLDRTSARRLLSQLNNAYSEHLGKNRVEEAVKGLTEKLGLLAFQRDFRTLVRSYGLDDSFCDGNWWFDFLYYYSCVIQDCPLECKAEASWKFDRLVLIGPDWTVSPERLFMQWELLLGDRQVVLWTMFHDRASLGRVRAAGPSVPHRFNWKKGLHRLIAGAAVGIIVERIWRGLQRRE
jgi:hypothetical protein